MRTNKKYRMLWIILAIAVIAATGIISFINQPSFGKEPSGARLERVRQSPNYRRGQFVNRQPTTLMASGGGRAGGMLKFLFGKKERVRPDVPVPVVKTDLKALDRSEELFIWFGHSSYMIQTGGKRILADPVFCTASPVSFINKPFEGTDIYRPGDMPQIDYLVITHDHWDHLDYRTVTALRDCTEKVICPLGVGEHFEHWGFDPARIVELDWDESAQLDDAFTVDCLPSRHFSGRGLSPNQTLWASYMFRTPSGNIYLGGDGGYGPHFAEIARRYPQIDIAVMENGQYNEDWRYIHLLPADLVRAVKDLNPRRLFTVHNSKYALARHPWDEPMARIAAAAEADTLKLQSPLIGEKVNIRDSIPPVNKWWENVPAHKD